jgi:hypothetical protein
MRFKAYSILALMFLLVASCADDSLLPLPYNERVTGAYLRIYTQTSNIIDLTDASLTNTGWEAVLEPVDVNGGDDLESIDIFVSHRRGTDLTPEVFLKTIDASIFAAVPEPTYSEYKRGLVRITGSEILTALRTITADPDGDGLDTNGDGKPGDQCPLCVPLKGLAAFGAATNFANGDQINVRYEMVMKDGRKISVANPQTTVNPGFANTATANSTPNITTGQFYNSPFVVILTARTMPATTSWVGTFNLTQSAIWSPSHSWDFHVNYPENLKTILFPDQTVTLQTVPGGLSTERQFTVQYRGQSVNMKINLEHTPTAANANLGSVFVPLQNTTLDCTSERELYWVTPPGGTFARPAGSTTTFTAPLPSGTTVDNRGSFNVTQTGLTGQILTIGIDDDADEYGRRNGYCTWTRRVRLTLTKN